MANNHQQCEIMYATVGPDSFPLYTLLLNRLPEFVNALKSYIRADREWGAGVEYELYKVNLSTEEWSALPDGVAPLMDHTTKFPDLKRIDEIWPDGFPEGIPAFIVKLKSDTPPPGPNPRVTIPDFEEVQSQVLASPQSVNSATLAQPPRFKKHQMAENAIYNGRPHNRSGPPISLFHPIFDKFFARLDPSQKVPPSQLRATLILAELSQNQYDTELARTKKIIPVLNELLDANLRVRQTPGTQADGSISAKNGAFHLVTEGKNEAGQGGSDPSIQGAISYAKYWSDPTLAWIRKASCCPSFILEIMGPWMCVLGAIMLDHPIVQCLTSFRWIGDDSGQPTQLNACKLARMFTSLSSSITALDSFYGGLGYGEIDKTRFHPYLRHFEVGGDRTDFKYVEAVSSDKLVYHARTGSGVNKRTIIVKFADSYHAEAHRLLADAQLAPPLLFVSSEHGFKVGGRSVIIMEKVNGPSLAELKTIPQCVKGKVSEALKLLHERGIVFGDLRQPNVMAVLDDQKQAIGVMLVDFDWCGKDGEGEYPAYINKEIRWPAGVGPGTTMRAEHDWEMFDKMFSS